MNLEAIKGKKKRLLQVMFEPELDNVEKICRKASIAKATYYKYVSDPDFAEAIKQLAIKTFAHRLPMTVQATLRQAEKGDMRAAKLVLEALQLAGGRGQTVNVAVHKDDQPTTLQIDTPEQLEQAIAQCTAEMQTLKELHANLVGMRAGAGKLPGDGIHRRTETPPHEEG